MDPLQLKRTITTLALALALFSLPLSAQTSVNGSGIAVNGAGGGGVPAGPGTSYDSLRANSTWSHVWDRGSISSNDPFVFQQTLTGGSSLFGFRVNAISSGGSYTDTFGVYSVAGAPTAGQRLFAISPAGFAQAVGFVGSSNGAGTGGMLQMPCPTSSSGNCRILMSNGNGVGVVLQAGQTVPTIGACGTSPSIVSANSAGTTGLSHDSGFTVTVGSDGPASCVVNFGEAWNRNPRCMASVLTTTAASGRIISVSTTTTAVTLTPSAAFAASSIVNVNCMSSDR